MNGKRAKSFIQTILFLGCMIFVFMGVNGIISHPKDSPYWINTFRIKEMKKLKKESVDVLVMGTSQAMNAVNPLLLYSQYGISAYNAGIEQQPIASTYLLLHELLKTQKPKVLLLEAHALSYNPKDVYYRKTFDIIPDMTEKKKILEALPEDFLEDSMLSYYIPILKYHSRYKEIDKTDFFAFAKDDYYDFYLGFRPNHGVYKPKTPMEPLNLEDNDNECAELDSIALIYFQKILDLCRENAIDVILFKTSKPGYTIQLHNALQKLSTEHQVPFIDFNVKRIMKKSHLNYAADQKDGHVNSLGATKITELLGLVLHHNYTLPDRRGDLRYAHLEEELLRYENQKYDEKFYYAANLKEYLNSLLDKEVKDYTVIISVRDEAFNSLDDESKKQLIQMGFQSDLSKEAAFHHSFIGIWENGTVVYEKLSKGVDDLEQDCLKYEGVLPDGKKYYVSSAGYKAGNNSSIAIDGVEKSLNKRGLNIVVYDNVNGRIVDSCTFDTYQEPGTAFTR